MNLNAGETLKPVFHFLDEAIANYGVYLYLALVWVCDCDRVDIQRRSAPADPASTTHHRRHRGCHPATRSATNADPVSRTGFDV
jgi:hypothetical protein